MVYVLQVVLVYVLISSWSCLGLHGVEAVFVDCGVYVIYAIWALISNLDLVVV